MPSRDRGASPERTRLAWRRTSLVATVVTVLLVRLAAERGQVLAGALAALCWVGLLVVAHRRVRALAGPVVLRGAGRPVLLALAVVALAGLGVAVVLRA